MLVQEFIDRTNYYPTEEEWNSINIHYTCHSLLDKDEFCKWWKKMNKSIIAEQIKSRKEKAEKEHAKNVLLSDFSYMINNRAVPNRSALSWITPSKDFWMKVLQLKKREHYHEYIPSLGVVDVFRHSKTKW